MRLRNPEFLLLLLLWIPMIWVYIRREKKGRCSIRFSDLSCVKLINKSPFLPLRHILLALRLLGFGLLVVACARPQKGVTEEEVSTEGVDIILVLDISYSMRALDFKPNNRLFVAKEIIKDFVAKREHDRIGLVLFAKRAFTKCPLTLDYNILKQLIESIDFDDYGDGTAIGTALATAANRIKDSNAKSKVIILTTDGANNFGEITPLTAAQAIAKLGIKVYTVGIGKEGEVPYPFQVVNQFTGAVTTQIQMVPSDMDEQLLASIASITGGKFFRATNSEKLKEIYELIDKLEKTEIKTKTYTTYSEHFFTWLIWGAILLVVELILGGTVFRRIP